MCSGRVRKLLMGPTRWMTASGCSNTTRSAHAVFPRELCSYSATRSPLGYWDCLGGNTRRRFDLTEEQKILAKNARDYFSGHYTREALRGFISKPVFDRARWQEIGAQGWLAALIEEKYGGLGL